MSLFDFDAAIREKEGAALLCGVDEAGRGPLAGPVYAAAVILPGDLVIEGLADSKKLTAKRRDILYDIIIQKADAWCIANATVAEIEKTNILAASLLAMRRAIEGLSVSPQLVLIDGNRLPGSGVSERYVIGGDNASASIAAASVLAKVARDRYMLTLAEQYPDYRFEQHKGYGTKLHYELLDEHGACPAHRASFLKKWRGRKKDER